MTKRVTLVKTLYYVPCIITTVAIAQIFKRLFYTDHMGLEPVSAVQGLTIW